MATREKWAEIMQLFQCLWNPQDPNFSNEVMKKACWNHVLRICNETSKVPVDMETLKGWVATNVDVLKYKSAEHIPNPPQRNEITPQKPRNTEDEDVPNLMNLALEYPCLWDCKDPNYRNCSMRERCKRRLLAKCNAQTDTTSVITMATLRRQLAALCRALKKHPRLMESVKQKCSELAASQVLMAHVRAASSDLQSVVSPPGTSFHQPVLEISPIKVVEAGYLKDIENEIKAQRNGDETSSYLSEKNSTLLIPDSASSENCPRSQMKLEENETRDQKTTNEANESDSKTQTPSLLALAEEYPCLWDREHPQYGDAGARNTALHELLRRHNSNRSYHMSFCKLRQRMRSIANWKQRSKKCGANDPQKSKDKNGLQQKKPKQKVQNYVVKRWHIQHQKCGATDRQITNPEKSKDKIQQKTKQIKLKRKVQNNVPFEISSDSDEPLSNYKSKRGRKETTGTTENKAPNTGNKIPNINITHFSRNEVTVPHIVISVRQSNVFDPNKVLFVPRSEFPDPRKPLSIPNIRIPNNSPGNAVPNTELTAPNTGSTGSDTSIVVPRAEISVPTTGTTVPNPGITVPNILISSLNGGITLPNTDTSIPNTPVFTHPTLRNTGITHTVPDTRTSVPAKGISVPNTEIIVPNTGITVPNSTITVPSTKSSVPVAEPGVRGAVISHGYDWCTFCGELKNDCTGLTENERPYLTKNCVDLHIADLWLVVLHSNYTPAAVCGECDRKLCELLDFVRRARVIQEKLKFVHRKRIIGEIENTTDESRGKTFKITIDLDSDALPHMSDDDCVEINHSDEIETVKTEIREVSCNGKTDSLTVDTEVTKENCDVIDMTYSDDDIETKPNIEVLASSSDIISTKVSEITKTASVDVSQPLNENENVINMKVEESPTLTDIELSNKVLEEKCVVPVNIDPMLVNSTVVNNEECDPRDDIPNRPRLADHDEHDFTTDTNIVSEINERKPNVSVSISSSDVVNSYNINNKDFIVTDEASITSDKLSKEVTEKSDLNSHTTLEHNDAVSIYKNLLLDSLSLDSGNKLVDIKPLSIPRDDVDSIIASKLHSLEAKYEKLMKDKHIASANVQSHTSNNNNDGNNDSESKHSLLSADSGDVNSHLAPSNDDKEGDESHRDRADSNETDNYETFLKAVLLQAINSAGVAIKNSREANNGTNPVGNVMVDVKKEIDEDTEMEV